MCFVEIMNSFKISSTPLDLLSLSDLIAVFISSSFIGSSSESFDKRNVSFGIWQIYQYLWGAVAFICGRSII